MDDLARVDGPYAEDLIIGSPLPKAPSITLDEGLSTAYQAITGDALRLPLSATDSIAVTCQARRLVNPGLVLQVAIGQSTVATRRVIANLFYRDVALHRQVHSGDTLSTTVIPTALALTRPGSKPRRAKVLLHIETTDQAGRTVTQFERLALLPFRGNDKLEPTGEVGDAITNRPLAEYLPYVPSTWAIECFPETYRAPRKGQLDPLADTVSSALELVRLTQNQAAAHRDPVRGINGRRLVYGGHAIGLAQASLSRMVPGLVTVLGWRSCDHLAPVFEGDVLQFQIEELDHLAIQPGRALAAFRVVAQGRSNATETAGETPVDVLDWRPVVLLRTPLPVKLGATS